MFRLYLITDPAIGDIVGAVERALAAIPTGRRRCNCATAPRADARSEMAFLLRDDGATGAPLLVNDRADVARAVDADGVHLRQDDRRRGRARARPALVGCSTHAAGIAVAGADFAVFGPVFARRAGAGRARRARRRVRGRRRPAISRSAALARRARDCRAAGARRRHQRRARRARSRRGGACDVGGRHLVLTRVFVLAMLLGVGSIVAKLYVFDFVRVQGNEMAPSVVAGDLVLVSRLFSRIERGDVVMLRHPRQPERFLIRRVVALPGETIAVKEGAVILDGEPARRERAGEMVLRHIGKDGRPLGDAVYTLEIEHLGERAVRTLRSPKARGRRGEAAPRRRLLRARRQPRRGLRQPRLRPRAAVVRARRRVSDLDAGADAGPALDPAQRRWTRVR